MANAVICLDLTNDDEEEKVVISPPKSLSRRSKLKLNKKRKQSSPPLPPPSPDDEIQVLEVRPAPKPLTKTPEQISVINQALPPDQPQGTITMVMAAAGTGKTTTIFHTIAKLIDLGHDRVVYIVFNKAAAVEAIERISKIPELKDHSWKINVQTTHAVAQSSWKQHCESPITKFNLKDESDLEDLIEDKFSGDILSFLDFEGNDGPGTKITADEARRQVLFFIRKQFIQKFVQTSNKGFPSTYDNFVLYYPIKLYDDKQIVNMPSVKNPANAMFYVKKAEKLWNLLDLQQHSNSSSSSDFVTFDTIVKNCQLRELPIKCSVLLVDESQDLNAAQIDWAVTQASLHKKQVFFVGDVNQSIYSFRGASPKMLMQLCEGGDGYKSNRMKFHADKITGCTELNLTNSFRFDERIACVANTLLYLKEKSDQPTPSYRITGAGRAAGFVTSEPLTPQSHGQVTVLAASNASLLGYCLCLYPETGAEEGEEVDGIDAVVEAFPYKVSILGKSESAGVKMWLKQLKIVRDLVAVSQGDLEPLTQNLELKKNFAFLLKGEMAPLKVWAKIKQQIEDHELSQFNTAIFVIKNYADPEIMLKKFEDDVVKRAVSEEKADLILGTIHQAKGGEWDNVVVLDDLEHLLDFEPCSNNKISTQEDNSSFDPFASAAVVAKKPVEAKNWQFKTRHGDGLNLWYVAVTRAKKILSVPEKMTNLVTAMLAIPNYKPTEADDDFENRNEVVLPEWMSEEVQQQIYATLVLPWKAEMEEKVAGGIKLWENCEQVVKFE